MLYTLTLRLLGLNQLKKIVGGFGKRVVVLGEEYHSGNNEEQHTD